MKENEMKQIRSDGLRGRRRRMRNKFLMVFLVLCITSTMFLISLFAKRTIPIADDGTVENVVDK